MGPDRIADLDGAHDDHSERPVDSRALPVQINALVEQARAYIHPLERMKEERGPRRPRKR